MKKILLFVTACFLLILWRGAPKHPTGVPSNAKTVPNDLCPGNSTEWMTETKRCEPLLYGECKWHNSIIHYCARNGDCFVHHIYESGLFAAKIEMRNGQKHGTVEEHFDDYYKTEYRNGRKHGKYEKKGINYEEEFKTEGEYRNDRKHGKWKYYERKCMTNGPKYEHYCYTNLTRRHYDNGRVTKKSEAVLIENEDSPLK